MTEPRPLDLSVKLVKSIFQEEEVRVTVNRFSSIQMSKDFAREWVETARARSLVELEFAPVVAFIDQWLAS